MVEHKNKRCYAIFLENSRNNDQRKGATKMNLDDVNWKHLIHAYGLATNTPEHLHHLLDDDVKLRNDAVYHLNSAIIHQSTLYPATPAVVKFIIESLTTPVLQDDESEFYKEQIREHIAREKELFESINPEKNTPETMESLEQSFSHRRKTMEGWLASDKVWTTLEYVLGFIENVGASLSSIDKTELVENSRILTPEERLGRRGVLDYGLNRAFVCTSNP